MYQLNDFIFPEDLACKEFSKHKISIKNDIDTNDDNQREDEYRMMLIIYGYSLIYIISIHNTAYLEINSQ